MNAILIRHTRIEVPPGFCYGHFDVPLADTFATDAAAVLAALPWRPSMVWSSPAGRCRRLAELLGAGEIRVDARLAELHLGEWEGQRWDDLCGPAFEAWKKDPWHERPPGGETAPEFVARVSSVRSDVLAHTADRIALVTHAGVIRAWRSLAGDKPLPEMFEDQLPFGSIWPAQ
jgi:alpha-ribazole phosphatase